mmetsp:Transcript_790/g.1760  ORF Transcript_790/g.1760 Transcript_790/m.1760 type:complete len:220 (+) Transcript_790:801-1460(+)
MKQKREASFVVVVVMVVVVADVVDELVVVVVLELVVVMVVVVVVMVVEVVETKCKFTAAWPNMFPKAPAASVTMCQGLCDADADAGAASVVDSSLTAGLFLAADERRLWEWAASNTSFCSDCCCTSPAPVLPIVARPWPADEALCLTTTTAATAARSPAVMRATLVLGKARVSSAPRREYDGDQPCRRLQPRNLGPLGTGISVPVPKERIPASEAARPS